MGGLDVVVTGQAKAQAPSDKGMGLHPELSYTQAQLTRIAASLDSAPLGHRSVDLGHDPEGGPAALRTRTAAPASTCDDLGSCNFGPRHAAQSCTIG